MELLSATISIKEKRRFIFLGSETQKLSIVNMFSARVISLLFPVKSEQIELYPRSVIKIVYITYAILPKSNHLT